jgi:hypothetical protein
MCRCAQVNTGESQKGPIVGVSAVAEESQMVITLIRPQSSTGAQLTVDGVSGQRAAGVTSAVGM